MPHLVSASGIGPTAVPGVGKDIYVTTADGHVTAPATVIECADDQEAIGKAAQLVARLIMRFPSDASG